MALDTERGAVRAMGPLTEAVLCGETIALVGESVRGKSMTASSIMRPLPENRRKDYGTFIHKRARSAAPSVAVTDLKAALALGFCPARR